MGAADVIPGVSGGTIAFLMGIYQELLDSIKSVNLANIKLLLKGNQGYIVASLGELSGNIPYTSYSTLKSYMNKNSDIIQKFTNAIYKAQKWVYEHTDTEVAEAIKPFFTDTSLENLAVAVKNYRNIEAWAKDPTLTVESLNKLMDIIELAGQLDKRAPYDKIVTTEYARNAIEGLID